MKTYHFNLETRKLTLAAAATQPVRRIDGVRGETLEFGIIPSDTLAEGATGVFCAKEKNVYSGDPVVLDGAWTAPTGEDTEYVISTLLDNSALTALFAGETATVTLMCDLTITSAGKVYKSQLMDLVLTRSAYNGDEGSPDPTEAAGSFRLSSPDGSQWQISITNAGQLERTKI